MTRKSGLQTQAPGLLVRSGIKAGGRVMCYEEINGTWQVVITPCSTDYYNPPLPTPPSPPTVQRLRCVACNGKREPDGNLSSARCEVCYL